MKAKVFPNTCWLNLLVYSAQVAQTRNEVNALQRHVISDYTAFV
jgi:hypothetical protein